MKMKKKAHKLHVSHHKVYHSLYKKWYYKPLSKRPETNENMSKGCVKWTFNSKMAPTIFKDSQSHSSKNVIKRLKYEF